MEYNAGSPEKYHIMINGTERVFSALLSLNKGDDDDVFTALENITNKEMIPFGIDPLGSLLCVSLGEEHICFYNHETEIYEDANIKIKDLNNVLF